MDHTRDERLQKTRAILRNAKFLALPGDEKKRILQSLVERGLAVEDLKMLLEERDREWATGLEKLPYDVFVTVVVEGDIHGKDLIRLCNSSPRLNEICNRSKDVHGEQQSEFLFKMLLQKMGKVSSPNVNPRRMYKYYTVHLPRLFESISSKIQFYSDYQDLLNQILTRDQTAVHSTYPKTIFEALYGADHTSFIGLFRIPRVDKNMLYDMTRIITQGRFREESSEMRIYITRYLEKLNGLFARFAALEPRNPNQLLNAVKERMKTLDKSTIDVLPSYAEEVSDAQFEARQDGEWKFSPLANFVRLVEESPRYSYIRLMLRDFDYEDFSKQVHAQDATVDDKDEELTEKMLDMIGEYTEAVEFLDFTDEELNFLISLHERVLKGELAFDTPFNFQSLM